MSTKVGGVRRRHTRIWDKKNRQPYSLRIECDPSPGVDSPLILKWEAQVYALAGNRPSTQMQLG